MNYRQKDESYRIAEKIHELLTAYPRRKVSTLLLEIAEEGDSDGRVMRKILKKL